MKIPVNRHYSLVCEINRKYVGAMCQTKRGWRGVETPNQTKQGGVCVLILGEGSLWTSTAIKTHVLKSNHIKK